MAFVFGQLLYCTIKEFHTLFIYKVLQDLQMVLLNGSETLA